MISLTKYHLLKSRNYNFALILKIGVIYINITVLQSN